MGWSLLYVNWEAALEGPAKARACTIASCSEPFTPAVDDLVTRGLSLDRKLPPIATVRFWCFSVKVPDKSGGRQVLMQLHGDRQCEVRIVASELPQEVGAWYTCDMEDL